MQCRHQLTFSVSLLLASGALLPAPPGPSHVTITTGPVTDSTRLDHYASEPTQRSLLLSIFQPATCPCTTSEPYMSPLTASVNTAALAYLGWPSELPLGNLTQPVCSGADPGTVPTQEAPLVLFSPGLGNSRHLYNVLASAVASYGYTVVTMDHTYEAPAVEFPDGLALYQNETLTTATPELITEIRTADVGSVLDALSSPDVVGGLLPRRGPVPFDTAKTVMFGHSIGGATAVSALATDTRLLGGMNLDGTLYGPVVNTGLNRPCVLFGSQDTDLASETWNAIWPLLTAFKLQIDLQGVLHTGLSDGAVDAATLGADTTVPPLSTVLGTLEGQRTIEVISAYVVAFFDLVLQGHGDGLLDRPSEIFPEVLFVRS